MPGMNGAPGEGSNITEIAIVSPTQWATNVFIWLQRLCGEEVVSLLDNDAEIFQNVSTTACRL